MSQGQGQVEVEVEVEDGRVHPSDDGKRIATAAIVLSLSSSSGDVKAKTRGQG